MEPTPLTLGIAAILTALGGGSIITLWLTRKFKKSDIKEEMHVTVESKKIDQDVHAFDAIVARLIAVEAEQKELRQEIKVQNDRITDEMVMNAGLKAANDALKKDNERQQGEIDRMRGRIHDLADKLQTRDAQIESFKRSLDENNRQMEVLRTELHETTKELLAAKRAV